MYNILKTEVLSLTALQQENVQNTDMSTSSMLDLHYIQVPVGHSNQYTLSDLQLFAQDSKEHVSGEVVADFPEPSSEHVREKRTNETSGQSDPQPERQNRGSGSYLTSH